MFKKNIILIIGQNKNMKLFEKSIKLFLLRNDITDIILVTWNSTDIEFVKHNTSIKKILVSNKKFSLSSQYQKYLYDIGIEYIDNNYKEDNIFILKTRMDVFIDNHQLNYIFSQDYKINLKNTSFPYKIWIPWTHITKPFYMEDACFYSHISVMKKLSPYVGKLFNDQGHSHIRWFLLLAREYNLYEEDNTYNDYKDMNSKFILNEITKNILIKYRECVKNHLIINTLEQGILFRDWNRKDFYKISNTSILNIIEKKAKKNLKIVYNNDAFFSIHF